MYAFTKNLLSEEVSTQFLMTEQQEKKSKSTLPPLLQTQVQAPNAVGVSIVITGTWIGGYGARFEINNTTNAAISKWTLRVTYNTTTTIDWVDLTLVKTTTGADLTPKSWTAPLRVGKTTIEFGGRGTPPTAATYLFWENPTPAPLKTNTKKNIKNKHRIRNGVLYCYGPIWICLETEKKAHVLLESCCGRDFKNV